MILGVDIGNSTIAFSTIDGRNIGRVVKIENEPESALFLPRLHNFLESQARRSGVGRVVICSVVPDTQKIVEKAVRQILTIKASVVGRDIRIPIANKYKSPRQVGKDRLLCAFAAREEYGAPAVVIDLGTAITFDGISARGEYLGGAIIPGLRLSAEALFEKTALLPRIRMEEPRRVIGRSTEESIQSGLFHGYGALCDGMIARLAREIPVPPRGWERFKVVMTGGHAEILSKYLTHPVTAVDQELIFKGISRLVR